MSQSDNPDFGAKPPPGDVPPLRASESVDPESRNMAMLAHLLGALLGILAPLIVWLIKKDQSPFVDDQGKEALNFHITLLLAYVVSSVLWTIFAIVTCGVGAFVPFPLIVWVFQVIFGIIAAVQANQGEYYRYPMTLRLIS